MDIRKMINLVEGFGRDWKREWNPTEASENGYVRFDLPSEAWSKGEWNEDKIKICRQADGSWNACTEFDQNVKRDLDDEEVASVREEFGLDAIIADIYGDGDEEF